jgi:micrococcal nuclease
MTTRRTVRLLIAILLVAAGLSSQRLLDRSALEIVPELVGTTVPDGFVLVTAVMDGDTIEIVDPASPDRTVRVRYIGIDTPETVHPSKPVQCFGEEASTYNRTLVDGLPVRLERDISDTDRYGRLLRYVYLEDGTFVNLELVRQGYATVVTYPPDVAHAAEFQAAQQEARNAGRGLWTACR